MKKKGSRKVVIISIRPHEGAVDDQKGSPNGPQHDQKFRDIFLALDLKHPPIKIYLFNNELGISYNLRNNEPVIPKATAWIRTPFAMPK